MSRRADGQDPCTAPRSTGTITPSPQKQLRERCRSKGYPETICNRAGQRPYETWTKIQAAAEAYGKNVHEHRPQSCASLPAGYVPVCESILTSDKGAYLEQISQCAATGMPPEYVQPCVKALQSGMNIDEIVDALKAATPAGAPTAPVPSGGGMSRTLLFGGLALAGVGALYFWRKRRK